MLMWIAALLPVLLIPPSVVRWKPNWLSGVIALVAAMVASGAAALVLASSAQRSDRHGNGRTGARQRDRKMGRGRDGQSVCLHLRTDAATITRRLAG